jgi:vacuolar-type H+-ATPase subunit I/STV1
MHTFGQCYLRRLNNCDENIHKEEGLPKPEVKAKEIVKSDNDIFKEVQKLTKLINKLETEKAKLDAELKVFDEKAVDDQYSSMQMAEFGITNGDEKLDTHAITQNEEDEDMQVAIRHSLSHRIHQSTTQTRSALYYQQREIPNNGTNTTTPSKNSETHIGLRI